MPKTRLSADLPDAFCKTLQEGGYRGECVSDAATRSVFATDSSIYEIRPKAVLFPRQPDDLNLIVKAASTSNIALIARGGGTGTNGQALGQGVIVDCSRYLNKIEEINNSERYAIVQPGVILDELNRAAAEHDLFFAPTVSTASRATLGGMAATDASGRGSRIFGRTSDHVLEMVSVLSDGNDLIARNNHGPGTLPHRLTSTILDVLDSCASEINRVFPRMNRGLTGYNLAETRSGQELSLVKLLCGSEGTLALTKRLKVRLLPRPSRRGLVVLAYNSISAALNDVARLLTADPAAVEFIDDKIFALAQQDPVWTAIESALENLAHQPVKAINFVEIIADSDRALHSKLQAFQCLKRDRVQGLLSQREIGDPLQIKEIWELRSKSVGLFGRMDPERQGTPFVEDAAVPFENLPDFVEDFRSLLDARGLSYGMFGHADVGCVHVRPALDMRRPEDAAVIRDLSDQVNRLTRQHKGLIWGEHGKGFRGEYAPEVFGAKLYSALCRIKAAFDPDNLLNPGKLASPDEKRPLTRLDAVPFRGSLDARMTPVLSAEFDKAIKCNGNGQCMGRALDETLCPSYKATGDPLLSPKGRSALLRNWARQNSEPEIAQDPALETSLYDSLSDCLGCKACASQCPVKVDIPAMRSRFLASYFQKNTRPLKHRLLRLLEPFAPVMQAIPGPSNRVLRAIGPVLEKSGLVDLPPISPARHKKNWLEKNHQKQPIVVLEDFILGTFDGRVIDSAIALLQAMGFDAVRRVACATGKPAYALGFKKAFATTARKTVSRLLEIERSGAQLVTLEPSFSSMFASEYREITGQLPDVMTIEAFLAEQIKRGQTSKLPLGNGAKDFSEYTLFTHCHESSAGDQSGQNWQTVFAHFGLTLQLARTSCCGMAGFFGHEKDKLNLSKKLFALSWAEKIRASGDRALATGFSCRCQCKRFGYIAIKHPIEQLAQVANR